MRKKLWYALIFFQILLIISLIRGLEQGVSSNKRIASLKIEKEQLEEEQRSLKEREAYVASEFYLEKVARDELHLIKPGETIVIVSDGVLGELAKKDKEGEEVKKKVWQKWIAILSGKI